MSERQIRPRPCLAMKLIAAGVTFSAARQRSPSFSRSSSSTRITSLPARISSRAASTEATARVDLGRGPRCEELPGRERHRRVEPPVRTALAVPAGARRPTPGMSAGPHYQPLIGVSNRGLQTQAGFRPAALREAAEDALQEVLLGHPELLRRSRGARRCCGTGVAAARGRSRARPRRGSPPPGRSGCRPTPA